MTCIVSNSKNIIMSNLASFYSDKIIFITGTTGFIGKVILEKILRSLPDFKKLFLLIR